MYWFMPRSGSIAAAGAAAQAAASAASMTRPVRSIRLRQVLELFNHDLDIAGGRLRGRAIVEQVHAHRLGTRHRHAGGELAPCDDRSAGADGLKERAVGLPAERVGHRPGGLVESIDVR